MNVRGLGLLNGVRAEVLVGRTELLAIVIVRMRRRERIKAIGNVTVLPTPTKTFFG
jgi:hypothetical protein